MWKSRAAFGAASPRTALAAAAEGAEVDWEPLPAVEVGSKIAVLKWGEAPQILIRVLALETPELLYPSNTFLASRCAARKFCRQVDDK